MTQDTLEGLKERFRKWNSLPFPSTEELPEFERKLKELLNDTLAFCQTSGEGKGIKEEFEDFLRQVDRMHRAVQTFPLPPNTQAALDPSQGAKAGELAEYLRAHGVQATVETLYRQVHAGWSFGFAGLIPIPIPVFQTVPSGLRVGRGKNFLPARSSGYGNKRR